MLKTGHYGPWELKTETGLWKKCFLQIKVK
jgi:hypothetical protein